MPEDAFLIWLLKLPHDADIAKAARDEVARIDRHCGPSVEGTTRYRELLLQATRQISMRPALRRGRHVTAVATSLH